MTLHRPLAAMAALLSIATLSGCSTVSMYANGVRAKDVAAIHRFESQGSVAKRIGKPDQVTQLVNGWTEDRYEVVVHDGSRGT